MSVRGERVAVETARAAGPLARVARVAAEVAAALTLLTRLRVGSASTDTPGAAAFPLVGLLVGGLVAVPPLVVGVISGADPGLGLAALAGVGALATLALTSGFMHLDGLADTADALLAADPGRAEVARRDPAIGVAGAATLVLVLAAEIAAIVALMEAAPELAAVSVVVSAVVARTVPVVAVRVGPRGPHSVTSGLGGWFGSRVGDRDALVAVVVAGLIVVLVSGMLGSDLRVAVAAVAGGGIGVCVAAWLAHARGRLDGDGLGATIELTGLAVLALAALTTAVGPWPTL